MVVMHEILHPNLEARPNQPGGSNQFVAHRGDHMAENMFDACSNARVATVVDLLLSGQRLVPILFPVNLGSQPCGLEVGFDLCGSVGRVGPDIPSDFHGQQSFLKDLPVMHRRISDGILPNELVLFYSRSYDFCTPIDSLDASRSSACPFFSAAA